MTWLDNVRYRDAELFLLYLMERSSLCELQFLVHVHFSLRLRKPPSVVYFPTSHEVAHQTFVCNAAMYSCISCFLLNCVNSGEEALIP